MPSKFKLKQRVEFVGKNGPSLVKGAVVALDVAPGKIVGVEFDADIAHGHSCDGKAKSKRGWWCLDNELREAT
jgi:hypothetical protein